MMELPEGQSWVFEMVNNILIEVMGTIAEQERLTIKQRQAEGIAAAKAKGKRFGRPAISTPENWQQVYASWKHGEITAKTAMAMTHMKRTTFYKFVKLTEQMSGWAPIIHEGLYLQVMRMRLFSVQKSISISEHVRNSSLSD